MSSKAGHPKPQRLASPSCTPGQRGQVRATRHGYLCHAQPPAHLNRQFEHQAECASSGARILTQGQLKVWLWHWINVRKTAMICGRSNFPFLPSNVMYRNSRPPRLGPFGKCRPRGSMEVLSDLMDFASSPAMNAGLFNEQKVQAGPVTEHA